MDKEQQPKELELEKLVVEQQHRQPRSGSRNWFNIPAYVYDEANPPWSHVDMNPPPFHELRRSERIKSKNPMQFVRFPEDPKVKPSKTRKRPQKEACLPDPNTLCPVMKEFFYPTTRPELTTDEQTDFLTDLFNRSSSYDTEISGDNSFDDDWEPPSGISGDPCYPVLLEINEATAAAAGWPPKGGVK